MSEAQYKRKRQKREGRLEIVAQLYRRGYSYRQIQAEVKARLQLEKYSLGTIKLDIDLLMAEWRKSEIQDIDARVSLELARIDEIVQELWEQWERSKTNVSKVAKKRKGSPKQDEQGGTRINTYQLEETETEVIMLGDVSYISEIRAQQIERRKILGIYAPEEKNVELKKYDFSTLTQEEKDFLFKIGHAALNENE